MSVEAVNGVTNNVPAKPQEIQTKEITPVEEKKNGTALLLGSLAALAIGGGIYFATRGKKGSSDAGSAVEKPLGQIKEMAVDAFKQAGNKFERGKAVMADGNGYTGKLTQSLEDGSTITREYQNGIIQKSTKQNGENVLFEKRYIYDENGNFSVFNKDNNLIFNSKTENNLKTIKTAKSEVVTDLNNNGRVIRQRIDGQGEKEFYYYSSGELYFEKHNYQKPDGVYTTLTTRFRKNGSKEYSITNGGEAEFFDKKGNVTNRINIGPIGKFNFSEPTSYYCDGMSYSVCAIKDGKTITSTLLEQEHTLFEKHQGEAIFRDIVIKKDGTFYNVSLGANNEINSIHCGQTNLLPFQNQQLYDELSSEALKTLKIITDKQTEAKKLIKRLEKGQVLLENTPLA